MMPFQVMRLRNPNQDLQNPDPWPWPAVNRDWVEQIVVVDADDLPLDLPWQEITYI